jgi:hypothetical protein
MAGECGIGKDGKEMEGSIAAFDCGEAWIENRGWLWSKVASCVVICVICVLICADLRGRAVPLNFHRI